MENPNNQSLVPPSMLKEKQIQEIAKHQTKALNEALNKKSRQIFGKCFMENQQNPERFAECLSTAEQKVKKIQKSLKYDGIFMETTYQVCMSEKKQDKAQCIDQFRNLLVSSQQRRIKEVEKI